MEMELEAILSEYNGLKEKLIIQEGLNKELKSKVKSLKCKNAMLEENNRKLNKWYKKFKDMSKGVE